MKQDKKKFKAINKAEQKEILLDMLKYIDNICRKNNINYSLIGGSLIGAIRHKGFIPWDDDIDIILDKSNYDRLIKILKNVKNDNYDIFIPNETNNYPLQFAKLINKKTILNESSMIDKIDNYGLFLDIFEYNYVPENEIERKKYYNKFHFYQNSLVRVKLKFNNPTFIRKIKRLMKNIYITIFGYKTQLNKLLNLFDRYSNNPTNYVMSNNPVYGLEKEIQKASDIENYIDTNFENLKVMIFKNYDNILKTTFGDYMKLPSEDKRKSHNLEVYWRDINE